MGKIKIIATFVALATILGCSAEPVIDMTAGLNTREEYREQMRDINNLVETNSTMFEAAMYNKEGHQAEINEYLDQARKDFMYLANVTLKTIPPDDLAEFHRHYAEYVKLLAKAIDDAYYAESQNSKEKGISFNERNEEAQKAYVAAEPLIEFIKEGE